LSAVAPEIHSEAIHAHVAFVGLDVEIADFVRSCLFQMGVEACDLTEKSQMIERKFEGFVIDLRRDDSELTLAILRSSERNRRAVIFGIYSDPGQLRRFSKHGVNAVIQWPATKTEGIKVLRSAQTLLVRELRRYARIPLAVAVEVTSGTQTFHGVSRVMSGGGMSVSFETMPNLAQSDFVELSLVIPPGTPLKLKGVICWMHEPDHALGVQFAADTDGLKAVRAWVDDYLGIE
jgi:hypothetical protein